MPDARRPAPALDAETIRRMAAEEVRLALSPAEVDAAEHAARPAAGGDRPGRAGRPRRRRAGDEHHGGGVAAMIDLTTMTARKIADAVRRRETDRRRGGAGRPWSGSAG